MITLKCQDFSFLESLMGDAKLTVIINYRFSPLARVYVMGSV